MLNQIIFVDAPNMYGDINIAVVRNGHYDNFYYRSYTRFEAIRDAENALGI